MNQGNNDCTHTLMQQAGFVYCVLWVQHINTLSCKVLTLPAAAPALLFCR
jgi:hypothetical protein